MKLLLVDQIVRGWTGDNIRQNWNRYWLQYTAIDTINSLQNLGLNRSKQLYLKGGTLLTNKSCVCGLFVMVTGYLGSIQINSLPTDNQLVWFLWTNGWKIYQASIMENEFTGISQSKSLPPM